MTAAGIVIGEQVHARGFSTFCSDKLQAVLDPVCQLLQQHADTLVRGRVLALKPRGLGDVFDRQEDLFYLVARPVNLARIEHHYAPAD